jgi:hypothetical protein
MKKATLGLTVGRKIQPRQFESLEVTLFVSEEVEYDGDRAGAVKEFTESVLGDFKRSYDAVCEGLGVEDKPLKVTHKTEDGTVKTAALPVAPAPAKKSLAPSDAELDDLFGDDKV